mgnify:CR=1 FL=1
MCKPPVSKADAEVFGYKHPTFGWWHLATHVRATQSSTEGSASLPHRSQGAAAKSEAMVACNLEPLLKDRDCFRTVYASEQATRSKGYRSTLAPRSSSDTVIDVIKTIEVRNQAPEIKHNKFIHSHITLPSGTN